MKDSKKQMITELLESYKLSIHQLIDSEEDTNLTFSPFALIESINTASSVYAEQMINGGESKAKLIEQLITAAEKLEDTPIVTEEYESTGIPTHKGNGTIH